MTYTGLDYDIFISYAHKPRRFEKPDRPRPPGKAPLEWILENMD